MRFFPIGLPSSGPQVIGGEEEEEEPRTFQVPTVVDDSDVEMADANEKPSQKRKHDVENTSSSKSSRKKKEKERIPGTDAATVEDEEAERKRRKKEKKERKLREAGGVAS